MNCSFSRKNGWTFTFEFESEESNSKNLCIKNKTFQFLEKIGFGQGLKILIEGKFTKEINFIDSKTKTNFNEPKLYLVLTPSTQYALKLK
jgi:hypothetical protein